ncbi:MULTISPECIES: lipopolysaccharide assembly protein LapB [unclassified Bacillus (in: firmicutes)]|uniref:tetratricopeptide repeat protein n=1 Tax=unclassified Bacillus (in: firmicutes) TaxID=185979 RepID=UPI0008EF36C7|nr:MULTISPECIES: tetratricopeptide repeat protein [unclassified Bacillus (in: firmicutes)]SFA98597.1 Tetratricopeptide repeat-containing protein [Bacillus sp. UNCCL13]SFQ81160.1 Tetratricopeptide repeat-containing protein [Bacillus sp. cl95]
MDKIQKIIEQIESGQHKEALIEYNELLINGTDEQKFVLGEEMFRYGFLDEAAALFENLLQTYPDEGELLVLLAEVSIELGNEEKAILDLDRVRTDDPSFPQALLLLADLYQMQGLYEVSEAKLLEAKKILPDEVVIDFALAELFAEQGEITKAIISYERVLEEKDEIAGVNVHQRLAETLSASGAFEEALPHYEKALDDKLEINTLFGFAFTALQAGMNRRAIEKFTELKELDPEYHSLYLHLAKAYEREEEIEKSFETIQQGIKQDEFNKDLFFYGGKLALKLGQEKEAEQMFREALALDPGFTEAALTLNKLFLHQEKYSDVIDLVKEIDLLGEEEPQLLWDEAVALHQLEEYSLALDKYEEAYNFFKTNTEFLTSFGYFLIEEGKSDRAAEIFKQLLKEDPSNEEYLEMIERLTNF